MKILLCYREFELGTLTFENNKYIFNSNIENEKLATKKYPIAMDFYYLANSVNRQSDEVFYEFEDYLIAAKERPDLIKKAKIYPIDSDFTKLFKLANLNFDTTKLYILQGK